MSARRIPASRRRYFGSMVDIANALGRPLGGAAALLEALKVLPEIADNTAAMAKATRSLPKIERRLAEIAEAASVLPQMDARMENIEAAMPVLVEVQTSLRNLPENMAGLDSGLGRLEALIDQLLVTLNDLGEGIGGLRLAVDPLQADLAGVARLVRRLPGGNRK